MEKQKLEIIKHVAGLRNEDDVEALSYYILGEPLEFLIRTYNRKTLKNISDELANQHYIYVDKQSDLTKYIRNKMEEKMCFNKEMEEWEKQSQVAEFKEFLEDWTKEELLYHFFWRKNNIK